MAAITSAAVNTWSQIRLLNTVYLAVTAVQHIPADIPVYLITATDHNLECPESDVLGLNVRLDDGRTRAGHLDCYWDNQPWYGLGLSTNFMYRVSSPHRAMLASFQFVLVDRGAEPTQLDGYYLLGSIGDEQALITDIATTLLAEIQGIPDVSGTLRQSMGDT